MTRPNALFLFLVALGAVGASCGGRTPLLGYDPPQEKQEPAGGGPGGAASSSVSSTGIGAQGAEGGSGGTGAVGGSPNVISYADFSFVEAETDVASAPNGYVAAAWIAVGGVGDSYIGYAISTDDGVSWGPPAIADTPDGRLASDPVLAVDAAGNFYLTWVGYIYSGGGDPTDMHIYVAKAPAGSTFFEPAVEASNPNKPAEFYDKPWITVTQQGTAIVTWASAFQNTGYGISVARSPDGKTWQQSAIVEDFGEFRNLAYPCAAKSGGPLYATFLVYDGSEQLRVELARSDDEGASWSPPLVVADAPMEQIGFDDPTCVAEGNDIWISYGLSDESPTQQQSDAAKSYAIRVAHSTDGGATIAERVDAHDAGLGGYFMHAQMIREDDGALDLVYYAGQFDLDYSGGFRRSRSTGPTISFGPSVPVEEPVLFIQARGDPQWLGDYTGIDWRAGRLYTTYATNLPSESHVAFASATTP